MPNPGPVPLFKIFPKRIDSPAFAGIYGSTLTALRPLIRYNSRFVPYPVQEETTL
jgi:hypothetical protein